jgi:glycosyltransferase involved in cell wall biosynthesis
LYVQYTDAAAYPPIEHSSALLAERGWDVVLLGIGKHNFDFPTHPRISVKRIGFVDGGVRQKLQYLLYFLWTLYWVVRWRPQWIYASDPLACPIVWWICRMIRVKVVYHEHDSPSLDGVLTRFMRQVFVYRGKVAREADICILPQQERLLAFLKITGRTRPAYCAWNCPRLDELADLNSALGRDHRTQDDALIIYYHGSITPDRLPMQLIVAASRFKGTVRLRVEGYETVGSIGYIAELMALAAKCGTPHMMDYLGTIPLRRNLLRGAVGTHVGLSLMPTWTKDLNMRHMVGASNKPFDYMACGLPLLVTDLPEWVSTFVEPGYGHACNPNDTESIEVALRWYLDHPDEREQMGRRCQLRIQQAWNYEAMFADVMASLEND